MMYSFYDEDLERYNYTCANSKTKRECLEKYLRYRGDEYWEGKDPDDIEDAIKAEPDEDILEDASWCRFELHEHLVYLCPECGSKEFEYIEHYEGLISQPIVDGKVSSTKYYVDGYTGNQRILCAVCGYSVPSEDSGEILTNEEGI